MPTKTASAIWNGTISEGSGTMKMANYEGAYSVPTRFGDEDGTSPEELLAAAHAGCYSMQLSALLTRAGHEPDSIETSAAVTVSKLEAGWTIDKIHLTSVATFLEHANSAKETCPVSKVLAAAEITLEVTLA